MPGLLCCSWRAPVMLSSEEFSAGVFRGCFNLSIYDVELHYY